MRISKLLSISIFSILLFTISCKTLTPQKMAYLVDSKTYHYWADDKVNERGVKFYVIFKGEQLHKIKPLSLTIGEHKMELASDLHEPSNRDEKSVLTCTTIYKEKKAKTASTFPEIKNTLYGKEPFKTALFKYIVNGKEMEITINDFTLHHKNM